jgi:hypothetical protein
VIKKIFHNKNFFKNPDPINSYWAGFIAADGCIREKLNQICIGLARKDKEHLQKFAKDCEYKGEIKDRIIKKDNEKFLKKEYETSHLVICGASELIKDLNNNFNITSKKSLTLKPPQLSDINSLTFIKGLIDGDGTIRLTEDKRLEFSIVGTKEILFWICSIFNVIEPSKTKLDATPRHRSDRTINNCWTYKLTGFRAYSILSNLDRIKSPRLDRKWNNIELSIKPTYNCPYSVEI